jgi:hypothetical protein
MTIDEEHPAPSGSEPSPPEIELFDRRKIEREIKQGAKAYGELLDHVGDDWNRWHVTIRGLRGLCTLAFAEAGTSDRNSFAYRQAIGVLLQQRQYAIYDRIGKHTRSICYKLMDRLEEISLWYETLDPQQRLRWKHPEAILKNCPRHLVAGGRGHNKPPAKLKKPPTHPEIERLKALLLAVIKRLAKHEPSAIELLDQVNPPADPDDGLAGL